MREYSAAKVIGDMGVASRIEHPVIISARNYNDAVRVATKKLGLQTGDKLSIVVATSKQFGRWEYII